MASQTRKITVDTAALFSGRAVGLLLGVFRLNYLTTYLGLSNFGIMNFATFFTALFQSLFDLGISQLIVREISRDLSRSNTLLGSAVVLKVIVVSLASIVVGAIAFASGFDRVTNWAVLLTTVSLAVTGISSMFLSALQAHRRMVIVSIANIANDAIISAAIILMIPTFPSVVVALVLIATVSAINLGILVGVYYRLVGPPRYSFDTVSWKLMLKESAPIAVSSLGSSIYTFGGPTILKYVRGEAEVGLYSSGYRLISILTLIPVAFTQVVYPIFSDFYANAKQKLEKALGDSLRVISIISIPLAMGTVVLAPKIFELLFTKEYYPGVIVLQIVIVANILGYMNWVMNSFLLAINRQVFLMTLALSVGVGVLGLCFLLIPQYGFVALPFLQAATECTLFVAEGLHLARLGYRSLGQPQFLRPLFAAGIMGVVLFALNHLSFFILVPIGGIVYFVVLFLVKGLGEQEMAILNKFLAKTSP